MHKTNFKKIVVPYNDLIPVYGVVGPLWIPYYEHMSKIFIMINMKIPVKEIIGEDEVVLTSINFDTKNVETAPFLKNLIISENNTEGNFQVSYECIDIDGDMLTHRIQIEGYDMVDIEPIAEENKYTYHGHSLPAGNYDLMIYVSDGNMESFIEGVVSMTSENSPPFIGDININNVNSDGEYSISYISNDVDGDVITHQIKIDGGISMNINPSSIGDKFTYNGSGLSTGKHNITIEVSDGKSKVSKTCSIVVPNKLPICDTFKVDTMKCN